jgi:hypothetical protein
MVDLTQLLLLVIIVILTTLLLVVGIQVFLLIRDLRKTLKKIDLITQEASEVSGKIKSAINSVLEMRLNIKTFSKVLSFLKEKTKDADEEKKGDV